MTTKATRTMSYSLLAIVILALAVVVSIGLLRYYKSRANTPPVGVLLSERGIPPLPASAKIDYLAHGGWLDRFLFIKATVPEPDFRQYRNAVATRYKDWIPGGPGGGSSEGRIEKGVTDEPAEAPEKFKSWFTPGKIQKGYRYDWDDGRDDWSVYFDNGEGVVYIRWNNR